MRSLFADIEPTGMQWTGASEAHITWSDGHESTYEPSHLRRICPCAECKGTHTGQPKAFKIVTTDALAAAPRQVVVERVEPVGNYAIAFTWGDGHREGIYTWSYLRDQCPCQACVVRRSIDEEGRR